MQIRVDDNIRRRFQPKPDTVLLPVWLRMMVCHNDRHTGILSKLNLGQGRDSVINRDQCIDPIPDGFFHQADIETIAIRKPFWNIIGNIAAEG